MAGRGPARSTQGTLFGKNTVGGAVLYTFNEPTMERSGSVLIRPGNFGLIETRTVLNLPIGSGWLEDRLAVRLRSFSEDFQGPVYSSFRDEYPGGREGLGFFGTLRFAPTERLIIDVTFGRFA